MQSRNHSVYRSFNRTVILQTIRQAGCISRVELARKLDLEKSTVSAVVNELVDYGLILQREDRKTVSGAAGRRPVALEINASFCCFLGVELQPDRFRAALVDMSGCCLAVTDGAVALDSGGIESVLTDLYESLVPFVRKTGLPLAALSIGLPGYINPHSGTILESTPFALRDYPIASIVNPWNVPVFVENDANCCAWSELLDSREAESRDFLAMLIGFQKKNALTGHEAGVGIGFGLVANASLHYGVGFMAGEFHSLLWKRGNTSQMGVPDERLATIAQDPDVFDEVLEEVLLNLSPLVALMAPSRIVLCGEAAGAAHRIRTLVETKLQNKWLSGANGAGLFATSAYGLNAVAVGAAAHIVVNLFEQPAGLCLPGGGRFDWTYLLTVFGNNVEYKTVVA